jgi:hypothetical protein
MKKIIPYAFLSYNIFMMLSKFNDGAFKNGHCAMKYLAEDYVKSGYFEIFASGLYCANSIEIIKKIFSIK